MPVAFIMEFEGGTLDQYDRVIELMGFAPGGVGPEDAHFHWATATDDGLMVTDVWTSDEAFQAFAAEKIGPFTAEVGLDEPKIRRHEVHNHLTGGSA